jgi:hypothetical protein
MADPDSLLLIMVALVLVGSAIWGWRGTRRTRGARKEPTKEEIEDIVRDIPSPSTSVFKITATDSARNINVADIANVMTHWCEGETCYATLSLRSGEKVTGLVATSGVEALKKQLIER